MKYLRRIFEEVNRDEYEELKDFCEMYLAYLLDDSDWQINIKMKTHFYKVVIWKKYTMNASPQEEVPVNVQDIGLFNLISYGSYTFRPTISNVAWNDISDQFIPFFKVLLDNYELVGTTKFSDTNVPNEEILSNLIPGNQPVEEIKFKVKRKI